MQRRAMVKSSRTIRTIPGFQLDRELVVPFWESIPCPKLCVQLCKHMHLRTAICKMADTPLSFPCFHWIPHHFLQQRSRRVRAFLYQTFSPTLLSFFLRSELTHWARAYILSSQRDGSLSIQRAERQNAWSHLPVASPSRLKRKLPSGREHFVAVTQLLCRTFKKGVLTLSEL